MALFTVQPGTFWLHDRASLMASATAFERDSRTVKQVTIPVHGANPQRRPQAPPPARRSQAPCGRRSADPRPWALRAATQGMRDRLTAVPAQAPAQNPAAVRRRFCHCGAFCAVTEPDGSTMTRVIVVSPL